MLKLQQEMLRYAQSHKRELRAPPARPNWAAANCGCSAARCCLQLASNRRLGERVPQEEAPAFGSQESRWPISDFGGSSRSSFGLDGLPLLCDVIHVGPGSQAFAG
jgi:hypothetical protein